MLCAATVVLWVRSQRHLDGAGYSFPRRSITVQSNISTIYLFLEHDDRYDPNNGRNYGWEFGSGKESSDYWWHGFAHDEFGYAYDSYHGGSGSVWSVPHWFIVCLTAALPSWQVVKKQYRRRRNKNGVCRACGYDLRATPNRCPECGTIPAKAIKVET